MGDSIEGIYDRVAPKKKVKSVLQAVQKTHFEMAVKGFEDLEHSIVLASAKIKNLLIQRTGLQAEVEKMSKVPSHPNTSSIAGFTTNELLIEGMRSKLAELEQTIEGAISRFRDDYDVEEYMD